MLVGYISDYLLLGLVGLTFGIFMLLNLSCVQSRSTEYQVARWVEKWLTEHKTKSQKGGG